MSDKKTLLLMNSFFIMGLSFTLLFYNIFFGMLAIMISIFFIYKQNDLMKKQKQEMDSYLETFSMTMDYKTKQSISTLHTPLCMVNQKGVILWYNKSLSDLLGKKGLFGDKIEEHIPEFDIEEMMDEASGTMIIQNFSEKTYKAIYNLSSPKDSKDNNLMICFENITDEVRLKNELDNNKTAIISFQIDSLDEVLDSTEEQNRPIITLEIDKIIKKWSNDYKMALKKISSDKYFAVLNEENLISLEENKFSILDDIRAINYGNTIPVSVSMGVSPFTKSIKETQLLSESALDISLARGGDQVAVKRDDKYSFYGGTLKAVEKKTRVKARIISYALKDLIKESSNILIMGHKYPDLDAIGSAFGIVSICEMLEKDSKIILEKSNSSIETLYNKIINNQKYSNIFVSKEEADDLYNEKTLVIVVDTNKTELCEYPELVQKSERVVVIDHHRRGEEFIENPVLVFHETYASSASEMVTELIQYIKDRPVVNPIISESLLAGITLDTKNFSFKTGVRTFEAAAFLRKHGADTTTVKTLFQGDIEMFQIKADALTKVKTIDNSIAITYCQDGLNNPKLVASKVADELLNFKGIQASFVLAKDDTNNINISARSLGKINVQIIMERLGGGGHIETAATQMQDISISDAIEKIEEQINIYIKETEK